MRVKLLESRAGVDFSQVAGDVVEVDNAEGGRMIAAGQAEMVTPPKARKPSQRSEKR